MSNEAKDLIPLEVLKAWKDDEPYRSNGDVVDFMYIRRTLAFLLEKEAEREGMAGKAKVELNENEAPHFQPRLRSDAWVDTQDGTPLYPATPVVKGSHLKRRERHLLNMLMEESCEVAQACSKLLRFGNRVIPDGPRAGAGKTNMEHLSEELDDVRAMVRLLRDDHDWDVAEQEDRILKKIKRVETRILESMKIEDEDIEAEKVDRAKRFESGY